MPRRKLGELDAVEGERPSGALRRYDSAVTTRFLDCAATATVAVLLAAVASRPATAQDTTARAVTIQDNSFLLEEAYNQEARVVQHINTFQRPRTGRGWTYAFTQEWPVPTQRHQLSYTIPIVQPEEGGAADRGVGDVALNYRYQLRGMHGGRTAIAPRLSVILPSGSFTAGTSAGGTGFQVNLPVSVELSPSVVTHLNAGATLTPRARSQEGARARTESYTAGQSVIWLLARRVNAMLEASWTSTERVESVNAGPVTVRDAQLLLSPGLRWAYNFANGMQIVPGLALPIAVGEGRGEQQLFVYFSVEHPF